MFLDAPSADCFVATEDGVTLQIKEIEGGAIGLWNNRGRTEKVRIGDFVTKVRKAGSTEWVAGKVAGDAELMLAALMADGVLEAEVKRAAAKEIKEEASAPVQEVKEEVAPVNEEAVVAAPVEVADRAETPSAEPPFAVVAEGAATGEAPVAEPVQTVEESAPKDSADSVAVADVEVEEAETRKPACSLSCM